MDAMIISCLMVALVGAERDTTLLSNPNFLVCTPTRELAGELLAAADAWRDELAEEWLDEKLPPGAGRTHIHVELSDTKDNAWTLPITGPGRKAHKIWLVTGRDHALGHTLAHEITHIILVTRYPGQIPAWANEGAASQCDDDQSHATRRRILRTFVRSGDWPQLSQLLDADAIASYDQPAYATAVSLTDFLLERRDKPTFVRFAVDGKHNGWDQALRRHYGISSVMALQTAWQQWTTRAVQVAAVTQ